MEAGKTRLKGEDVRGATRAEVEKSHLSILESLMLLGIPRSTYYSWLAGKEVRRRPRKPPNRLTDAEVTLVIEQAKKLPDVPSRELAWYITDNFGFVFRVERLQDTQVAWNGCGCSGDIESGGR